jgi:hypothetical protein
VLLPAARLLVALHQDREARTVARTLDESGSPNGPAYSKVVGADLALAGGRADDAITLLREVLKTTDLWIVRLALGSAYLQANRHAEALAEFEVCHARREESTMLFGDEAPSLRYLSLLEQLLARAREGLEANAQGPVMGPPYIP